MHVLAKNRSVCPQGAVFDLDGTLIATRQLYAAAYAQALAPFIGRHLTEAEIFAAPPRAETEFLLDRVNRADAENCLERFFAAYAELHAKHFRGIYDGVPALFDTIIALGIPIAVVTGKSRRAWTISAQHAPMPAVACWVFSDDVAALKPAPDGLLKAGRDLGVDTDGLFYLGDGLTDLEAAKAAGMMPAAALWSKKVDEREHLRACAEDLGGMAFATPQDVAAWLARIS